MAILEHPLLGKLGWDYGCGKFVAEFSSQGLDQFLKLAREIKADGYKLVVLDTLGRAMQGLNENAQEHASKFTALVERINRELGATVLALHHTGHENQQRHRGSTVFHADTDTCIRVDRPAKDGVVSITVPKQKDAPEWEQPKWVSMETVNLEYGLQSLVAVRLDDAPQIQGSKSARAAAQEVTETGIVESVALRELKSHFGGTFSNSEFARMICAQPEIDGISESTIKRRLRKLRVLKSSPLKEAYDSRHDRFCARIRPATLEPT